MAQRRLSLLKQDENTELGEKVGEENRGLAKKRQEGNKKTAFARACA